MRTTCRSLEHARKAATLTDHEDVRWFSRCLEVGGRFAEIVALSAQLRVREDGAARERLAEALDTLEVHILSDFRLERTERLGGDPGCWLETIANLRTANKGQKIISFFSWQPQ